MRAVLLFLIACGLAALAPVLPQRPPAPVAPHCDFPGWPSTYDDIPLVPVPLSEVERGYERDGFIGRIARFAAGNRILGFRWVAEPTRHLHPVALCWRGAGWIVGPIRLVTDDHARTWSRFEATKNGESVTVLEAIEDADRRRWTDASSWYWDALIGRSRGPWTAITVTFRDPRSG